MIELTGGNPFRSRAFSGVARTIERLEEPVGVLLEKGALTEIRGIGAGLADQIEELLARGSFEARDNLLGAIPPGLLDVLSVKGLGAKKARVLWQTLGVQTLDDLETAAVTGRVESLPGFGARSQASILENISALRAYRKQRHYADAFTRASDLCARLKTIDAVHRVEVAGDLRRRMETVSGVDLVMTFENGASPEKVLDITGPLKSITSESGQSCYNGSMDDGLPLRIHPAEEGDFGRIHFLKTGSIPFLDSWIEAFGNPDAAADEIAIFSAAGSAWVPPELREDAGAVTDGVNAFTGAGPSARNFRFPRLIEVSDLKGTLHNHSTYSDGAHTLAEMADAARAMGLSYFGICDHSRSLKIAHGLSVEDVIRQQEEIKTLNERYAGDGGSEFRIFSGIESDILSDGSLDYADEVLAAFDFVVASVHTGFNMSETEATERVIRAVCNRYTSILGHPTGRLLLRREGYPINHRAVLEACSEFGVSVELNANPYRLDLDWRWIREARDRDILISINPDAHAIDQLPYVEWGVSVARKGRLTAEGCLNALTLDAFEQWISRPTDPDTSRELKNPEKKDEEKLRRGL